MVKATKFRDALFRPGLFECPALDMLIDLYIARATRGQVSVTSLSIASKVPATTALRHIGGLVDNGEAYRVPDPYDKRRSFVVISDEAFDRMTKFFLKSSEILTAQPG